MQHDTFLVGFLTATLVQVHGAAGHVGQVLAAHAIHSMHAHLGRTHTLVRLVPLVAASLHALLVVRTRSIVAQHHCRYAFRILLDAHANRLQTRLDLGQLVSFLFHQRFDYILRIN